jgi:hypothetical protein
MPYKNPADKRANSRKRYKENPGYFRRKAAKHRRDNPELHAYLGQRHTAKQRGVAFLLTFEEWLEWWGDDFERRGRKARQLQMCRYNDEGAYELGNIYKATQVENDRGPRQKPEES